MTSGKKAGSKGSADVHGFWADEGVPDLSEILGPHDNIDAHAFAQWFGQRLGSFRGITAFQSSMRSRSDEIKALRKLEAHLAATIAAMNPLTGLLPITEADMHASAYQAGLDLHNLRQQLLHDLCLFAALAKNARVKFEKTPPKPGRKSEGRRDRLLAEVVKMLRESNTKDIVAEQLARDIFRACGIAILTQPTAEKAVKRGKQ